jgi:uncharacterized SAM-binding protein YcdF (DUF218 family)
MHAGGGALLGIVAVLTGPSGLVLQKIIARLVMPAAWVWDLAWFAFIVGVARAQKRVAIAGAIVGTLLTFAGSQAVGEAMFDWLERDYRRDPFAQGSFDAVIVLGGGVDLASHGQYQLGTSGDRVALAARLHHAGHAKRLVISGTVIEGLSETFDSRLGTERILQELGVPASAIVSQPGHTRNTREEAIGAATLAKQNDWRRVGVITSASHMRRSLALFDAQNLAVTPLAANFRGAWCWDGLYSIVPREIGFYLVSKASWEVLGAAVGF